MSSKRKVATLAVMVHGGGRDIPPRIDSLPWDDLAESLDELGYATTAPLLTPDECRELTALYTEPKGFRSHIDMARYRFGLGEYKYFANPLPPLVRTLREAAYPRLARIANRWMEALDREERFPPRLASFLALCRAHGQNRPTPLILYYERGGYNCLHQDLYGEVAFPLQLTCVLSRRGEDFTGGEFLLVEQRPRAQSRGHAISLEQGEAIIFPTSARPVRGTRGVYRAAMRHGVSRLLSGKRFSLGIIFHDAR